MIETDQNHHHRQRVLALPTGSAKIWFERRGDKVSMQTEYKWAQGGQGGGGEWQRCSHHGCLGEAISQNGPCIAHADTGTRQECLRDVANKKSVLSLRGIALSQQLYDEIARSPIFVDSTPIVPINFSGTEISATIRFDSATFDHWLEFTGAEIFAPISFKKCTFKSPVNMRHVFFNAGPPSFTQCEFLQGVDISCSRAERVSIGLESCRFSDSFYADGVKGALLLGQSMFDTDVFIRNADANLIKLDRCTVLGDLDVAFTRCRGFQGNYLKAERVHKVGPFEASTCQLNHARFGSRVHIELVSDRLEMVGAELEEGGLILVEKAQIVLNQISLGSTLRVSGKSGDSSEPEILELVDADAGKMSFARVNMTRCAFYGAHDLGNIDVESTVRFPMSPWWAGRRRFIADEFAWRTQAGGRHKWGWNLPGVRVGSTTQLARDKPREVQLPELSASQVAATYRELRRSLEAKSDMSGAADFYFGEMEMRRHNKKGGLAERAIITLYWLLAGYGLRASRAIVWWALLVFFGAAATCLDGFLEGEYSPTRGLIFAVRATIPGLSTVEKLSATGQVIEVLLRICGPILVALALLAIRGRIIRKPGG